MLENQSSFFDFVDTLIGELVDRNVILELKLVSSIFSRRFDVMDG